MIRLMRKAMTMTVPPRRATLSRSIVFEISDAELVSLYKYERGHAWDRKIRL
jgi:hypothetical protein